MAIEVTLTLETSGDLTNAEALRLFTAHHGYTSEDGTRGQHAKATTLRFWRESIQAQRKLEASQSAVGNVPENDVILT